MSWNKIRYSIQGHHLTRVLRLLQMIEYRSTWRIGWIELKCASRPFSSMRNPYLEKSTRLTNYLFAMVNVVWFRVTEPTKDKQVGKDNWLGRKNVPDEGSSSINTGGLPSNATARLSIRFVPDLQSSILVSATSASTNYCQRILCFLRTEDK